MLSAWRARFSAGSRLPARQGASRLFQEGARQGQAFGVAALGLLSPDLIGGPLHAFFEPEPGRIHGRLPAAGDDLVQLGEQGLGL